MTENDISYKVRGAIFKIYNQYGPGMFESVYEVILAYELQKAGLEVKTQVELPIYHDGIRFDKAFRVDVLVEDLVILEIKSVENLAAVHHKQLVTYLKLSELKLGMLINFNTDDISKSIFRKVNKLE